jgi:outer membrane protein assembly factor BamB
MPRSFLGYVVVGVDSGRFVAGIVVEDGVVRFATDSEQLYMRNASDGVVSKGEDEPRSPRQ